MNIEDEIPLVTQHRSDNWTLGDVPVTPWSALTHWEQQIELLLTPKLFHNLIPFIEPSSIAFGRTLPNQQNSWVTLFHATDHQEGPAYAYEHDQDQTIYITWHNRFTFPDYNLAILEQDWEYFTNKQIILARLLHSHNNDNVYFHFFR